MKQFLAGGLHDIGTIFQFEFQCQQNRQWLVLCETLIHLKSAKRDKQKGKREKEKRKKGKAKAKKEKGNVKRKKDKAKSKKQKGKIEKGSGIRDITIISFKYKIFPNLNTFDQSLLLTSCYA